MKYDNIKRAVFIDRPNRFIAHCEVDGAVETVHVKNTGRCRELLVPGAEVWVQESDNPNRKTRYDLISVQKGDRLVNMDSLAPNKLFREYVESGMFPQKVTSIRSEYSHGDSRFDFLLDDDILVEVKGVTLEREDRAYFPDAPTERGRKHLRHLAEYARQGGQAYVCFVVQMEGIKTLSPNDATDPEFGAALREAQDAGVNIIGFNCRVVPGIVEPLDIVDIIL